MRVALCSGLNRLLHVRDEGLLPWFDEERMEGNVVKQMCEGIDASAIIVVFVTSRYAAKVAGDNAADNCQKEFNYACLKKTNANMVREPRFDCILFLFE